MKRALRLLPLILGFGLLAASPGQARNYDCSKPGNANKTVCKNQAAAPAPTAPTAAAPAATKIPAARNYDCSKAGNANKAVCKAQAPAPTQAAAPAPAPAPSRTTAATAPALRPAASRTTNAATTNAAGPNGATAMCVDGTYSHSAHRSGTCSRHGGVKTFY